MDLNAQLDHFLISFAAFSALAVVVGRLRAAVRRYEGLQRPTWVATVARMMAFINPPRAEFPGAGLPGDRIDRTNSVGQIVIATFVLLAIVAMLLLNV